MAEISRPDGMNWKKSRSGRKGGAVQCRHARVNWYHPYLWVHIDAVAKKGLWSPQAITTILQRDHPTLFKQLNRGTVYRWISPLGQSWSSKTLENVSNRHALAGSGQAGILTRYPRVVERAKGTLLGLRKSGVPVNVLIGRGIMLAIIQEENPELLSKFTCSEVHSVVFK